MRPSWCASMTYLCSVHINTVHFNAMISVLTQKKRTINNTKYIHILYMPVRVRVIS